MLSCLHVLWVYIVVYRSTNRRCWGWVELLGANEVPTFQLQGARCHRLELVVLVVHEGKITSNLGRECHSILSKKNIFKKKTSKCFNVPLVKTTKKPTHLGMANINKPPIKMVKWLGDRPLLAATTAPWSHRTPNECLGPKRPMPEEKKKLGGFLGEAPNMVMQWELTGFHRYPLVN